jgi:flagellin
MSNSVNTNISALKAQQSMVKLNDELDQAMARLSSGLRINSAADDAAGSAIATKMESQVRSLGVAIRNSYDAISMTQTAEGALGEVENMLQRIRELAVQAGNSTLSDSDRAMIQSEVSALTAEIDKISSNTHFNGVNLLDGSSNSLDFQIGMNADDAISVNLEKSDTLSLGLAGSVGVQTLSSERVTEKNFSRGSNIIAAADVKINGQNAFASNFSSDLTGTSTNEAKTVADAINANSGVHGANADAFNNVTSDQKGTFNMGSTFTINGDTVELATSYAGLVSNINQSVSGINAELNGDNTITLSNTTGSAIVIAGASASDVGFTAGTYTGFVSLTNIDGSAVKIEAGSEKNGYTNGLGTIADLAALGFNEISDGKTIETDTVSGTALSANEMKINNVLLGSSTNGQASTIADAINNTTGDHGVTANAKNEVTIALKTSAIPGTNSEFFINNANVDLSSTTDVNGIVLAINNANIGDVRASANSNGNLVLSSASGADIHVDHGGDTDFILAYKDVNGTVSQAGVKGGSALDADSLYDNTTVSVPGALTLLTPSNFNSQVSIQSVGTTAAALASATTYTADTAITLSGSGTGVFATGLTAELVFGTATSVGTSFTVTGLDLNGNAQSEVVAGRVHSSDNTATTTKAYSQITSVVANKSSASSATVAINYVEGEADNNFTIVGKDVFGNTITEIMSGTGGTLIAKSKNVFESVTSITASKATAQAIDIGNHSDLTSGTDTGLVLAAHDSSSTGAVTLVDSTQDLGGAFITIEETKSVAANGADGVFTITGVDLAGNVRSERVTGPAGDATVTSTIAYAKVTAITVSTATTTDSVTFGTIKSGDSFTARGALELSNNTGDAIKLEAVGADTQLLMEVEDDGGFAATETVLQKMGLQNQSQSFEVTGTKLDVGSLANATASIQLIDNAINKVSSFRSSFGAVENRIDASISNLTTLKVNTESAQSRIADADFANETSNLTKAQILSQAATSMLAQANASKQNLLALLQG